MYHGNDMHTDEPPGHGGWLAEQDRSYWLGVLRKAAEAHHATLRCSCREAERCEHCQLAEALAYTAEPGGAGTEEEDGIDLAVLARLERAAA